MDDRVVMGLRITRCTDGTQRWDTPDQSSWRLVGESQLQRWHSQATPAPAWLAYHPGVRMDVEMAVGYSLGYSRAAMLRTLGAAGEERLTTDPDDDDDDDDDDSLYIVSQPEPWGVSVSTSEAIARAQGFIEQMPHMPKPPDSETPSVGWITEYRKTITRYAVLAVALQLSQLEANDRMRQLLLRASEWAADNPDHPGILKFPEEDGNDVGA